MAHNLRTCPNDSQYLFARLISSVSTSLRRRHCSYCSYCVVTVRTRYIQWSNQTLGPYSLVWWCRHLHRGLLWCPCRRAVSRPPHPAPCSTNTGLWAARCSLPHPRVQCRPYRGGEECPHPRVQCHLRLRDPCWVYPV